jgi:putative ABC transport system permease protein
MMPRPCSAVDEAAPIFNGNAQIVFGNQNWSTGIYGSTPSVLYVRDWPLTAGRIFNDQEVKSASKVCLIGKTIVDNLFGDMDPIGRIIRIRKLPFTVVGVLAEKGQSLVGQDQDDTVYVPITTAQRKIFGRGGRGTSESVRSIIVKTRTTEDLDPAMIQITDLLKQRHRIGPTQEPDFTVRNLTQMMNAAEQSTRIMTLLLGAIASVSMLVGGIGIMNIMLVSVTERTREIGIRMAVGAKSWDIRLQFIIEALTLSLIGGLAGIIIGFAAAKAISGIVGWPTIVSPVSVFFAFGFSGLIGMFFGFYPAYKASLLHPIDALRYE